MNKDEGSHTVERLNLYGCISKSVVKVLIILLLMVGSASAATTINIHSNVNDVYLTLAGVNHLVVDGSQFMHPNTQGPINYTITKTGYTSQSGTVTLPMESVYNWTIVMVVAPAHKVGVSTASGIGTAAIKKNGVFVGALDYGQPSIEINGYQEGDTFEVTYTPNDLWFISKYCTGTSSNPCYFQEPVTNYVSGTISTTDYYVTFFNTERLVIDTIGLFDLGSNSLRISSGVHGTGTVMFSVNDSDVYNYYNIGTTLVSYTLTVPYGTHNVCSYSATVIGEIRCDTIVFSPPGVTPVPTTTPAPTPEPPTDIGYHIVVNSYPNGARVAWGGDDMGLTPTEFYTYGMNNYNISVIKEGYQPFYESGVFISNRTFNLTLTPNGLPENRGTHLLIDSYPHGAKVFRNGDLYGTTPTEMYLYGMNQTTLVFKLDGYWDKTISGDYNTTTFINAILVSKSGSNPTPPPDNNPVTPPSGPNKDFFQWMINSLSGMIGIGTVYKMPAMLGIVLTVVVCIIFGGAAYRETKSTNMALIVCALMVFLSWVIGFFPGWALLLIIAVVVGINYLPTLLNKESA